jgi:hypothetical protein
MVGATIDPSQAVLGSCHREGIASLFWYRLLCSLVMCLVWLSFAFETLRQLTLRILVLVTSARNGGRVLGSAALSTLKVLCNTLRRSLWGVC